MGPTFHSRLKRLFYGALQCVFSVVGLDFIRGMFWLHVLQLFVHGFGSTLFIHPASFCWDLVTQLFKVCGGEVETMSNLVKWQRFLVVLYGWFVFHLACCTETRPWEEQLTIRWFLRSKQTWALVYVVVLYSCMCFTWEENRPETEIYECN